MKAFPLYQVEVPVGQRWTLVAHSLIERNESTKPNYFGH